jgi:hypothetical protein
MPYVGSQTAPANLTPAGDAVYFSYGGALGTGLWRAVAGGVAQVTTLAALADHVGAFTALAISSSFSRPTPPARARSGAADGTAPGTQVVRVGVSVEFGLPGRRRDRRTRHAHRTGGRSRALRGG